VKQICTSSGPGRISRFINITEFPLTHTLLDHSFSLYRAKFSLRNGDFFIFTEKAQLLPQTYGIYSNKDVLYLGPLENVDC